MRRHANYFAYRIAQGASLRLPAATALRLADRLSDRWWRWAPKAQRAVQHNLSIIREDSPDQQEPSAREVFRNFGRYVVEFFTIHREPAPAVAVEGLEYFQQAQRAQRGVIIATGHLGNWEVGAVVLRRMGFSIAVVALPHEDPRMDQLFNQQRQRCGIAVIPVGVHAARQSLECLRAGQLIGVLGDRTFDRRGMMMPLCGGFTMLPQGPATLSVRSRAPIVPTFLLREAPWVFRLCFEPPIWPQVEDGAMSAIQAVTRQYAAVLERYLKRVPEQWLMFQPVLT